MKRALVSPTSRRLHRGKAKVVCFTSIIASAVCFMASDLVGQNVDPFAIRTETDLVLVPTVVLEKNQVRSVSKSMSDCFEANIRVFSHLSSFDPYLPKDCDNTGIPTLNAKDFSVFDDGVLQNIENVTIEPNVGLTARDNLGYHQEWSYTPRSIWSSPDLQGALGPGSAGHYYLIAYIPRAKGGACHGVKVKVHLRDAVAFSRSSYCVNKRADAYMLMDRKFQEKLEKELTSSRTGRIPYQVGFFYSDSGNVRVYLALELPWDSLSRQWEYGRLHAEIGLLGQVSNADHLVQSFNDFACCLTGLPTYVRSRHSATRYLYTPTPGDRSAKTEVDDPVLDEAVMPARYQTQINLSPGNYVLRLVFSDNNEFGRLEIPLSIEPFARTDPSFSSIVLCKRFRNARAAAQEAAAARLAPQYVPLVSKALQFTPTGNTKFAKGEVARAYFEIYAPMADAEAEAVRVNLRIVNAKTGVVEKDLGSERAADFVAPGSPVIPMSVDIPIESLPLGSYRLEIEATDSAGRRTAWREADFSLN